MAARKDPMKMRASDRRPSVADKTRHAGSVGGRSSLVALLLAGIFAVGGTLAYIFVNSDDIMNTFQPTEVTCVVDEIASGMEKSDVKVVNTGDVDAYIRAAIVVNWADENGNVLGAKPVKGTDYTVDIAADGSDGADGSWALANDGFWYWTCPVAPDSSTGILIESCSLMSEVTAPAVDYCLSVEILCSAIQADGVNADDTPAVVEAWSSGVRGIDEGKKLIVISKTTDAGN